MVSAKTYATIDIIDNSDETRGRKPTPNPGTKIDGAIIGTIDRDLRHAGTYSDITLT